MITVGLELEVGVLNSQSKFEHHLTYTIEPDYNENINDMLIPLLDDKLSTYAELRLRVNCLEYPILIGSFKKIKMKSGGHRWIVTD